MTNLFDRIFGRSRESSASMAKERLQFVLVHDRINIPPDKLQEMKQEILAVISKYVMISGDDVDIALQQRDRNSSLLVAEVPFSKRVIVDPDEDEVPQPKYQPLDDDSDLDEAGAEEAPAVVPPSLENAAEDSAVNAQDEIVSTPDVPERPSDPGTDGSDDPHSYSTIL